MIIGISGRARAGKSLIGSYLAKRYNFEQIAFADTLKKACKEIFGLTEEQVNGDQKEVIDSYWNMTPRSILQKVGTDCLRDHFDKNIWINAAYRKISSNPEKNYVLTDCRFINETLAVKSWGGILLRVKRPQAGAKGTMSQHPSETEMESFKDWDHVIDNQGQSKEELFRKVDKFMEIWHG